jgi:O-acetyl-ADP-ribose deacetylase (regulator of RNase III)
MDQTQYTWQLGQVVFHLVRGDLFDVPASAIVNSEQTDFVLAGNPHTISGQIRSRFGHEVQGQLDALTNGKALPPGTVLATTGGGYSAIFHAGFHHPTVWLDPNSEDNGTAHLNVIRSCVSQILRLAVRKGLPSVAFPLIGSGLFDLDPRLLAREFFEEVLHFATEVEADRPIDVWLVIYDGRLLDDVLEAGVQSWIRALPIEPGWEPFGIGIPHVDLFERQLIRERHPRWVSWMLVRYAEIVTGYILSELALSASPPVMPEEVVRAQGYPLCFGDVRNHAERMARQHKGSYVPDSRAGFLSELIESGVATGIMKALNGDRNDLAHGRQVRDAGVIRGDIERFLRLPEWRVRLADWGRPQLDRLNPWVRTRPGIEGGDHEEITKSTGVFERWREGERCYIIPWSGTHFSIPNEE